MYILIDSVLNKRNLKIIRLYIIGLLFVVCYFLLENSDFIPELVQKSNKLRYKGFPIFFLTGLLKYALLLVGMSIIIFLSLFLIKEKM